MSVLLVVACTLTACLEVDRFRRKLIVQQHRRAAAAARRTPRRVRAVAAAVREPEPFWFPEPPACSLDEAREVLVHVAPAYVDDVAEVLEFPVGKGWDVESIIKTLAEIESL